MTPAQEKEKNLYEQTKIKETLATEGSKIIFNKLLIVAEATLAKEQQYDPFTMPGEINKARQLRYVIKTLIPNIVEGLVNYDPEAIDLQVAPKDKWKIMEWIQNKVKAIRPER